MDSRTSPFGLLTLISVLLVQICALRRESQKVHAALVEETKVQTALATWEEAWKAHPHSTTLPEAPHGPLMADSILILNTAYYRLYASEQLDALNALARMPSEPMTADSIDHLYNLYSHPGLVKALVRACRSLLIRVRLGMRHLGKTASLNYACYGPLPACDGSMWSCHSGIRCFFLIYFPCLNLLTGNIGLLIAWHCLGQRLSKFQVTEDPMITIMMNEIVSESEYSYGAPIQREVIAMTLYRDLIRERWIWHCRSPPPALPRPAGRAATNH